MSLIIDAIRRAQQLRLQESEATRFLKEPGWKGGTRGPGGGNFLVFVGVGSGIILILLLLLAGRTFYPLLTSHGSQKISFIEKQERPAEPTVKEGFQASSKKDVPTDRIQGASSSMQPSVAGKRAESVGKGMFEGEETVRFTPHEKVVAAADLMAPASSSERAIKRMASSRKEEVISHDAEREPRVHSVMKKAFVEAVEQDLPTEGVREPPSSMEQSVAERSDEPLGKQVAQEKRIIKDKPLNMMVAESRRIRPARSSDRAIKETALSRKEQLLSQPHGVEQEGGENSSLASDVLASFNLGVSFYNKGEISKAIQAYQKVIELDPTYIEAYNNLGIIYQEIGDFDRALSAYQKSTEINPQYEKGYNNRGILLYLKGRYEEAMGAFQEALAINPTNIESHINLGILFKKQGQLAQAVESYEKALAINPLHGEAHYNIALVYEQLEDVGLAIVHYQKFVQLSSKTRPDLVRKVKRHLDYLMETKKYKRG